MNTNTYIVRMYYIRMTKENTTINLDSDIKQRARDMGLNISQVTEEAIKAKSGIVEVDTNIDCCDYCGIEMSLADAENPSKGLVWLCPEWKWWCQRKVCVPKRKVAK